MKPGIKTTEFWLALAGVAATVLQNLATDVPANGWTVALITAAYAISRAVAKFNSPS